MKLATLLLFLAIASADVDDRTHGLMNGRAWHNFSPAAKTGYVLGLSDGAVELATNACSKASNPHECFEASIEATRSRLAKSTVGEIIEGVNDFYRDPANVQIPIPNAMKYFQLKVQGAKPDKLAETLASMRQAAASQQ